jgi:hypothetical protein
MTRTLRLYLFISVLSSSFALSQTAPDDELFGFVLGIEGRAHLERGEFIKDQLRKMDVGYFTAPFTTIRIERGDTVVVRGENIVARLGKGEKRIVIGAHFDAVPDSPGANDNGSGVSVALALVKHLQDIEWTYGVDFCFFDGEESGLTGSSSYVRQFVIRKKHLAMINLDIEGTGEEVYVGPVGENNRFLMPFIHEAARRTGFPLVERSEFPATDNEPFGRLQLENISISVVPKGDGDRISKFERNGYKADSADMPKMLGVMHTTDDRSNLISPRALAMSYEFTKTLLLLLNEAHR